VLFFVHADKSDIMIRLTGHAALMAVGIAEITHIPSQQASPEFYTQLRRDLEEFASYGRTSLQTLVLNSKRTAENIAAPTSAGIWPAVHLAAGRICTRESRQSSSPPAFAPEKQTSADGCCG